MLYPPVCYKLKFRPERVGVTAHRPLMCQSPRHLPLYHSSGFSTLGTMDSFSRSIIPLTVESTWKR